MSHRRDRPICADTLSGDNLRRRRLLTRLTRQFPTRRIYRKILIVLVISMPSRLRIDQRHVSE